MSNPLFLNIYLKNRQNCEPVSTRGELLDSYLTNFKGDTPTRFIVQFVLPLVAKKMVAACAVYEITRGEIAEAIETALRSYIGNEYIYQNYIAPKFIDKDELLESRIKSDWIELIIKNIGLIEVSSLNPRKLHFVHQYYRDYFAAKI